MLHKLTNLHIHKFNFLNFKENRVIFEVGNHGDCNVFTKEEQLQFDIEDRHNGNRLSDIELASIPSTSVKKQKKKLIDSVSKTIAKNNAVSYFQEDYPDAFIEKEEVIEVSPDKFPFLKELFGDFSSFRQDVIIMKSFSKNIEDGRFSPYIYSNNGLIIVGSESKMIAIQNELTHSMVSRFMENIVDSSDEHFLMKYAVESYFKNFDGFPAGFNPSNFEVNEFLSDVISFQVDPVTSFIRAKNWGSERNFRYLKKKIEMESRQEKYNQELAMLELSGDIHSDKYQRIVVLNNSISQLLKELYQVPGLDMLEGQYNFTFKIFRFWLDENPNITPDQMAEKYMQLGKKLVKFYKDKEEKNE